MNRNEKDFRELWTKIATTPNYPQMLTVTKLVEWKKELAKDMGIRGREGCPACVEAFDRRPNITVHFCNYCPLDWGGDSKIYACERASNSLYKKWRTYASLTESKELAFKISLMNWNKVEIFYSVGDVIEFENDEQYIIVNMGPGIYGLVTITNFNRKTEPIKVGDHLRITQKEFDSLKGYGTVKRRIPKGTFILSITEL
jgi:hypothetical protein